MEQDTARAMEELRLKTQLGWAYEDPDDATNSREVDVMGYRRFFHSDEHRLTVSARVLAECKQSGTPYVLIGREHEEWLRKRHPAQHTLRYNNLIAQNSLPGTGESIRYAPAWSKLGLDKTPGSPSLEVFRASQLVRLDRGKNWTANNSGIFNSLVFPLAKALRAAQKQYASADWPTPARRNDSWNNVALHFPVVVTSAPLYRVDATHPESSIAEVPWGKVIRQLETKTIKGRFEIDVVNYQHLPGYLEDQVIQFSANVAQTAEEDPGRFVKGTIPTVAD
ncbi:hypothetical protein FHU33_3807 [Blastococcus colisei]|uniref:Uncharacterized protein n=1 Tax=Blastococcus colisei TaxID=1564162 RepID=A0A543PJR9_9ACTN|nr:hypothetical protein FHU33_3807 [Blastococcus colisei]